MQKSLELAISRFEAGDITGVVVSIITSRLAAVYSQHALHILMSLFQGVGSPNESQQAYT